MDEPEPFDAPLVPDWETVQEYVVLPTLLLNATDVALPEQMLCVAGVTVADGAGLTVTVTVWNVPKHPPAVGVTVYITFCAVVVLLVIVLLSVLVVCVVKLSPVVLGLSVATHV